MPYTQTITRGITSPLTSTLNVGVFDLDTFMAAQADGLYFDTTKTDRFFQESTGPTLADDVGEVMGLALSQRAWNGQTLAEVLAGQSERCPDGVFTSTTNWTANGCTLGVSSGVMTLTSTGAGFSGRAQYIAIATVVGRTYSIRGDLLDASCGLRAGTSAGGFDLFNPGVIGAVSGYRAYFVATSTTSYISLVGSSGVGVTSRFQNVSVKEVPGKHGIQATGTLKPTRQTTGAKFDGSDDNWLTSYTAGAGENFIVALVDVPASIAATQGIAGTLVSSSSYGLLSISTAGTVRVGLGDVLVNYGDDFRGQTAVVGMSYSGGTGRAFSGVGMSEFPYGSAPASTTPYTIGALKTGAGVSNFFGGSIKKLVAGRQFLDLATYLKIRHAFLTQ